MLLTKSNLCRNHKKKLNLKAMTDQVSFVCLYTNLQFSMGRVFYTSVFRGSMCDDGPSLHHSERLCEDMLTSCVYTRLKIFKLLILKKLVKTHEANIVLHTHNASLAEGMMVSTSCTQTFLTSFFRSLLQRSSHERHSAQVSEEVSSSSIIFNWKSKEKWLPK